MLSHTITVHDGLLISRARLLGNLLENPLSRMRLPRRVVEGADELFRRAFEAGLTRGRPSGWVVAALIYTSCRLHSYPITISEVAACLNVSRRGVASTYRLFVRALHLNPPTESPEAYISHNRRVLGEKVAGKALEILRKARSIGFHVGRKPAAVAAAAAYIASNGSIKQSYLGEIFHTTPVSVRGNVRRLAPLLE
jgi:transcription initiation factor TFIIIB Brf1 subunit/transcription initiation factor TFIIB